VASMAFKSLCLRTSRRKRGDSSILTTESALEDSDPAVASSAPDLPLRSLQRFVSRRLVCPILSQHVVVAVDLDGSERDDFALPRQANILAFEHPIQPRANLRAQLRCSQCLHSVSLSTEPPGGKS